MERTKSLKWRRSLRKSAKKSVKKSVKRQRGVKPIKRPPRKDTTKTTGSYSNYLSRPATGAMEYKMKAIILALAVLVLAGCTNHDDDCSHPDHQWASVADCISATRGDGKM